ncbi:MAG TPA: HAD-IA family hydrolase [Pseudomonadales bacterium]|nr:HAD-IA family hydrolase [Pseudomonadales bacterium]
MALKAVLFDLDGTLLDTAPDFIICVNRLRQNHDQPPLADKVIRAEVSNGARAMTRLASGLAEGDPALEALNCELLAIYREILGQHSVLFPGMADSLRWIEAQGLQWGIVTNKPSRFTLPLLEKLSLPFTASSVVCPDHVSRSKPDPEPMLLACNQCGCEPAEAIYLGDHIRDIEAGRAAGMLTAGCDWGYIHPEEDIAGWGADHRIATPYDIPDLIKTFI